MGYRVIGVRRLGIWLAAVGVVAAMLAAWRRDILFMPPYEDQSKGLFLEANFLYQNHFDYAKLRYDEAHFNEEGKGARSYMVSVMPTLVALAMTALPPGAPLFFSLHLFELVCAAAALVALAIGLAGRISWDGAILVAVAVATMPLVSVQIDMIGMDIPTAALAVASAVSAARGSYGWGAALATGAFLMKPTGSLVTLATLAYLGTLALVIGRDRGDPLFRATWRGLGINLAALVLQVALFIWGDPLPELRQEIQWPAIVRLPKALELIPDLGLLLVLSTALSLVVFARWLHGHLRGGSLRVALRAELERHSLAVISWWVVLGTLASMTRWIAIPRYFTVMVPFLFTTLAVIVLARGPWRRLGFAATIALIATQLANQYGTFYPRIEVVGEETFAHQPFLDPRSCAFLERSREYLEEQEWSLALARLLERQYPSVPILTPDPYIHYLTEPCLGYVTRPLKAERCDDPVKARDRFIELSAAALANPASSQPILILANVTRLSLPEPEAGDEILVRSPRPEPVVVYRKRWPPGDRTNEQIERWYFEHTWPGRWSVARALHRLEYWRRIGAEDRSLSELASALATASIPDAAGMVAERMVREQIDPAVERSLVDALARGQPGPAWESILPTVGRTDPALAQALVGILGAQGGPEELPEGDGRKPSALEREALAALTALNAAWAETALEKWAEAAQGAELARARFALAVVRFVQGQTDRAANDCRASRAADPSLVEAAHLLGLIALASGDVALARRELKGVLATCPRYGAAANDLGVALARSGDVRRAQAAFADATVLSPLEFGARGNLVRSFHGTRARPAPAEWK